MDQATHSKIVSFLWGIADADVIPPMCLIRRLDAVPALSDSSKAEGLLLDEMPQGAASVP